MMIQIPPCRMAFLALFVLGAARLPAADTIYMQIPGIKGESTSKSHVDWINIYNFAGCISNAGKASACDISVNKDIDLSTTSVYGNLITGKGTGAGIVKIDVCGISGTGTEVCYYKLEMNNVYFTSASSSTSDGAQRASEAWSMTFAAIKWTYIPRWFTATPGAPVTQCWDFSTNTSTCP